MRYHEIVRVIDGRTLVDRDCARCLYAAPGELEGGFYIVMWPTTVTVLEYNGDATFHGPFATRKLAVADVQGSIRRRYLTDTNVTVD